MNPLRFAFSAPLWLYSGKGGWHFLTLPAEDAARIRFLRPHARCFVPVAVKATIGKTEWNTSLFPDSRSDSYLLAVKAGVRKAEQLTAGSVVAVEIELAA